MQTYVYVNHVTIWTAHRVFDEMTIRGLFVLTHLFKNTSKSSTISMCYNRNPMVQACLKVTLNMVQVCFACLKAHVKGAIL